MFVGREDELEQLKRLDQLKKASLIVCKGRRRIGKSRLIQEFGKTFSNFLEIQGLAPRKEITAKDQLDNFVAQLAKQSGLPQVSLSNWRDAFLLLAKYTEGKKVLVFFDEISWMASGDKDFAGQLKIIWDTEFKKNPQLRMVLCGSVSSWIEENILNSTDFVGRLSLVITLRELSLKDCPLFWGKRALKISIMEKFKLLSIIGGIPRYLEEINPKECAEKNIMDLCFSSSGLLFNEFDNIFHDIFNKKAKTYSEIVKCLVHGAKSFSEICDELKIDPNGVMTNYLNDLEISGFIRREHTWKLNTGKQTEKTSKYRLSDNYVRFYLKYILPNVDKIKRDLFKLKSVDELSGYESIMGLQFENLILNNISLLIEKMKIPYSSVVQAGTYFQKETARQKACQIDLLIQTKGALYIGEIKFKKKIGLEVVKEVQQKIQKLKYNKNTFSVRPILLYAGELEKPLIESDFFDKLICFGDFLGILEPM